jgi:uncharacterized protein (TIGR02246 family)
LNNIHSEVNSMKRIVNICVVSAVAFIAMGCNTSSGNHDADVASLKANEAQWNQAWASKDANKVMGFYADDAILMVDGEPASVGKAAIAASTKGMIADPATDLKFTASRVEVSSSGDMGYTQGTYTMAVMDPQTKQVVHDHGTYVTTYRKQADGSWKAVMDVATSEVPPPSPAPAAGSH